MFFVLFPTNKKKQNKKGKKKTKKQNKKEKDNSLQFSLFITT